MAVNHLYEQGHRRIGLALARDSPTAPQLRRGWEQALAELGLDTEVVAATLTDVEGTEREERFGEIVSACRDTRTTALIVHADPQAILFEHYCTDHGIDIPRDLAIVAYDDEVAENGTPPISALRPAKERIGHPVLDLVVADLGGWLRGRIDHPDHARREHPRGRHLQVVRRVALVEEPAALAGRHRVHQEAQLVDQPCGEQLLHHGDRAGDEDAFDA